jgi:hypothetical protein
MAIEDARALADKPRRRSDTPAALDRALRKRGTAAFYDRYRPLAAAP